MRFFFTLSLLLIYTTICLGQNNLQSKIDSIHNKGLQNLRNSGSIYFDQAKLLIEKIEPSKLRYVQRKINDLNFLKYYIAKKNYSKSDSLIEILEKKIALGDTLIYQLYREKAKYYESKGDLKNALAISLRNLELAKKQKDSFWLGRVYLHLASHYTISTDDRKAISYREKAIKIFSKNPKYKIYKAEALFLMASNYGTIDKTDTAITFVQRAVNVDRKGLMLKFPYDVINNLAIMHYRLGNIDSVKFYLDKNIKESKKNNHPLLHAGYVNRAAFARNFNNDIEEALKYIDTATYYFKNNINKLPFSSVSQFYKNKMSYIAKAANNPMASEVLREYDSIARSVYENKISGEIEELKTSFGRERKLNEKNNLLIFLLFGIGFLIMLGILFYIRKRFLYAKESLQMQQRLLRSQMNPHFMFNTLSTLRHHMREDPEFGVDYLSKFSKHLRIILENSTHNYVLLEKELDSLRGYLDLQLLRYPKMFEYRIDFHDMTEEEYISIPPMLIQPIVENCIKHGFSDIDYMGEITITLTKKNNKFLLCEVEDNGNGLSNNNKLIRQSTSQKLISGFLKKATGKDLTMVNKVIDDMSLGVLVSFLIPYKTNGND